MYPEKERLKTRNRQDCGIVDEKEAEAKKEDLEEPCDSVFSTFICQLTISLSLIQFYYSWFYGVGFYSLPIDPY